MIGNGGGYSTPPNHPTHTGIPAAPGSWGSGRPTAAQNDDVREALGMPTPTILDFDAAQPTFGTPPGAIFPLQAATAPPHTPERARPVLRPWGQHNTGGAAYFPTHLTYAHHAHAGLMLPQGAFGSPLPHQHGWYQTPGAPHHPSGQHNTGGATYFPTQLTFEGHPYAGLMPAEGA